MPTIVVERGDKSYRCWSWLQSHGYKFISYRLFRESDGVDEGLLAFDIEDAKVAVECVLRFG